MLLVVLVAACDASDQGGTGASAAGGDDQAPPVELGLNVEDGANQVPVSTLLRVDASGGSLDRVRVRSSEGPVPGRLVEGGTRWQARERLEPGTAYTVRAVAEGAAGEQAQRQRWRFRTVDLGLDRQTYASVAPLDGETVGVGMPVIVQFDIPVTDRASIERHLEVRAEPEQTGSWHWVDDSEVHWRPKEYWEAGTDVVVDVDINGVPAGGGIFGQDDRRVAFTVGERVIHRIDVDRHRMRTFIDGDPARTMLISAGKQGWETRSGTKVIMAKHRHKTMDAATLGVEEGDPEYYNIEDVEYALRVTHSGEFLHAAPWSAGSQGSANVSHGCVGMRTSAARWVYDNTKRGDVVEVTGTDRQMSLYNGWGDWNTSFADYRTGSAL